MLRAVRNCGKRMVAFTSVDDLKAALVEQTPDDFYSKFVEGIQTPHFSKEKLEFVSYVIEDFYKISPSLNEMVVVGSSKIGFALHDKFRSGALVGRAFRPYGSHSDIDLAVCSPSLFSLFWHELSRYSCSQSRMPVHHDQLGDYLVYGWLRQDKVPQGGSRIMLNLENLRFVRGRVRQNRTKGHPKFDIAIFYDKEHLRLYQCRSILECRKKLENPL